MVFLDVEKIDVKLKVKFFTKDGNEFRRTIARIKSLRGARFDSTFKCWFVDDCSDNVTSLMTVGIWKNKNTKPTEENKTISKCLSPVFSQCPEYYKEFATAPEFVPNYDVKERQRKLIDSVELKGNVLPALRNYQRDFLKFMEIREGRAILADDMGTGKTLQSLSWLAYSESFPALIVVTAPTKLQWEREYNRWLENVPDAQPVEVLKGQTPRKLYAGSTIIINWDILHYWLPVLLKYGFKCIIGDEAQAIGNPDSKRAKAFLKLAKKIPQCIVMSGTPARSRPAQYWSMISCVEPEMFPKYKAYLWRYCGPKIGYSMNVEFTGLSNEKELHSKLMKCMLRRTKDEIMTELPKKQVEVIPLESDESVRAQYDNELSTLDENATRSQLELKVMAIVRCAYMLKQKSFLNWVKELIEITGEKIVVFCWHRDVVDLIEEGLSDFNPAKIYGGMSLNEREEQKSKFIEDNSCKVIVGNIQALGTGVDGLQKVCCKAVFAEFSNTITDSLQAEDRLHRGGQEKPVTIYYTCAKGTLDEDMMKALDEKRKVLDSVLNGKETEETDLLSCLFKRKYG